MKIAIIGIRGVPVIYSGFESFALNLGLFLVKYGWTVTVYCRSPYVRKNSSTYKGIKLIILPTLSRKNFETFIHSLFSSIHATAFSHYDVVYFLGLGNAPFALLLQLFGIKTIINVDGMDWKRQKWNFIARGYLQFCSYLVKLLTNVITDSQYMYNYYLTHYRKDTIYIPYGVFTDIIESGGTEILNDYKLKKNTYFIWVGRIVPENHLEELLESFHKTRLKLSCVVVGDDLYQSEYKKRLLTYATVDKRIFFTGFLDRNAYTELLSNAYAYIETKRSGGTHPSLIEAMYFSPLIISNNHSANRTILGSTALYYDLKSTPISLRKVMVDIASATSSVAFQKYKRKLRVRYQYYYNWRKISREYIELFTRISKS